MVTVYVWNAHYAKHSLGHASMAVSGGQPSGNIYISWWPAKGGIGAVTAGVPRVTHSSLKEDESYRGEGRKPDHIIHLEGLDETAIKTYWNRWSQNGHYQGLLFSCATTVGWALKEGGGDRHAPQWTDPTVWTPADVWHRAAAIQKGFSKH